MKIVDHESDIGPTLDEKESFASRYAKTDTALRSVSICSYDRIDWNVAKRFLSVIYSEGPILRTKLAMKSRINYNASVKYVTWMKEIGWIEVDDKRRTISLTESGTYVCKRLDL